MNKVNWVFLIFLLGNLGLNQAIAEKPRQAILVLDTSQVMKDSFGGKTKIESVKEGLNGSLSGWTNDVYLGLTAYGGKGCSGAQVVRPVGALDVNEFTGLVSKLESNGESAIGLSLQQAAEALNYTKEKATVVLISGGPETCGKDICVIADGLEKNGADFKAYVIGVGVIEKTQKELECVANLTGGKYFTANDAASLKTALASVVQRVNRKVSKPVAEAPKVAFSIKARINENVEIVASHVIYRVVEGGMNGRVKECTSFVGNACENELPAGKYLIKSRTKDDKSKMLVEIQDGGKNDFTVFLGQTGDLSINASEVLDGPITTASHIIHRKKNNEFVFQLNCSSTPDKACKSVVPVGEYRIKSASSKHKAVTLIEVKESQVNKFIIDLSASPQ